MANDSHTDRQVSPASDHPKKEAEVGLWADFWGSLGNGLKSEANGAIQLLNRSGVGLSEFELSKIDKNDASVGVWAAEMAGQICSTAITFGAMRWGMGRVGGSMSGVPSEIAQQSVLRQAGTSGAVGAFMGGVLTPSDDPDRFWTDRLQHTGSGFVSMYAMGGASALSAKYADLAGGSIVSSIMKNGIARNAAGGYVGGFTGDVATSAMNLQAPDWQRANIAGAETAVIGVGAHGVDLALNGGAAGLSAARRATADKILDFADKNLDSSSGVKQSTASFIRSHISEPITIEPVTAANLDAAVLAAGKGFSYAQGILNPEPDFKASVFPDAKSSEIADPHQPTDRRYFVARDRRGQVVGTTGLYKDASQPDAAWLGWFSVTPEARGQGVGTKLLDFSISEARKQGSPALRLYTSDHPGEAVAQYLYEKNGFAVVGREDPNEYGTTILYRERPLIAPWREGVQNLYGRLFAEDDPNVWRGSDGSVFRFGAADIVKNKSWHRIYKNNFPAKEQQPIEFLESVAVEGALPRVDGQITTRNGVTSAWSITSDYGQGSEGRMLLMPYVASEIKAQGTGGNHVQRTLANLKEKFPDAPGMLVEMEPVDEAGLTPEELKQRQDRLRFWLQQGGEVLPIDYRIPSSVEGEEPLRLNLVWVSFGRGPLSQTHLQESVASIYRHGYELPDDDPLVVNFHNQFVPQHR